MQGNAVQLNKQQVKKFQELYFRRFGKRMSYKEAVSQGSKLVSAVNAVYSPNNMKMKSISNEQATSE